MCDLHRLAITAKLNREGSNPCSQYKVVLNEDYCLWLCPTTSGLIGGVFYLVNYV